MHPRQRIRSAAAALAVAVALAGAGVARSAEPARWAEPVVVVSDRTGDARWQVATRYAVAAWNSSGAGVTLVWSEGGVGCQPEGTTVPVCRRRLVSPMVGLAHTRFAPGRLTGSFVEVTDRVLSQVAANAVATHEIGHALGLDHSAQRGSIMGPGGNGTDHLALVDHQALWALYGRAR